MQTLILQSFIVVWGHPLLYIVKPVIIQQRDILVG